MTDVGLPNGMNGRQVADAARALRPGLKVLFITGYAENAVVGNGHLDPVPLRGLDNYGRAVRANKRWASRLLKNSFLPGSVRSLIMFCSPFVKARSGSPKRFSAAC